MKAEVMRWLESEKELETNVSFKLNNSMKQFSPTQLRYGFFFFEES